MKPKTKSKEPPYPFNAVLTREQWEIGSIKMRKTIDEHKELARLFQEKKSQPQAQSAGQRTHDLLMAPPPRLVVLAGPNGVGKTVFGDNHFAGGNLIFHNPDSVLKELKSRGGGREEAKTQLTQFCQSNIRDRVFFRPRNQLFIRTGPAR